MKNISTKWFLSLVFLLPWSCSFDECGELEQKYTNITGLSASNVLLIEGGYTIVETLEAENRVNFNRYGINVMPTATLLSQHLAPSGRGFTSAAYACSPALPMPSEVIADIAIFSDKDFMQANSSRVISAGDTLNSVFTIYDYYSGRIVGLPDFLMDEGIAASEQGFILQPSSAPAEVQQHEFTVHYRLENGEFYEITLPAVELLP